MEYKSEHPCNVCGYRDKSCPYGCTFFTSWKIQEPCTNYECMYYDGDLECNFRDKCGAYRGKGKPDLDFDEDEED